MSNQTTPDTTELTTVEELRNEVLRLQKLIDEKPGTGNALASKPDIVVPLLMAPDPSCFTTEQTNQIGTHVREKFGTALSAKTKALLGVPSFQYRVQPWLLECFGATVAGDVVERANRFLEESIELYQASDRTRDEAHALVDYVFDRPRGEAPQEVGGAMLALAAYCLAKKLDMHQCGEVELARVWSKIPEIRVKQDAKPRHPSK
jgi:hypothetical protein